jgi:hypothetical protein
MGQLEIIFHVWTKVSAVCTACPAGKTKDAGESLSAAKATSSSICMGPADKHPEYGAACGANHHVLNHVCTKCEKTFGAGYVNPAGDDPEGADTACTATGATVKAHKDLDAKNICAANYHVKNHKCAPCPAGTSNAKGDDKNHHDTACAAVLCPANHHVSKVDSSTLAHNKGEVDYVCKKCADHLTNTAGDDCSKKTPTECYANDEVPPSYPSKTAAAAP